MTVTTQPGGSRTAASRAALPTGTVTFFFTDVEGSTRLLESDPTGFPQQIDDHFRLTRTSIEEHGGVVVRTEGDAFFAAFDDAGAAVEAAAEIQRAHHHHPWPPGLEIRVRIGLHTGMGRLGGDDYVGIDVHRAARIAGTGHGGQVVLSDATRALIASALPSGVQLADLGEHRLKDMAYPQHLYQLVIADLPADFPPLRTLDATPNNLPVQLTTFIDRDELAAVVDLLGRERFVTLTGPGGTGKSRLALQAAAAVAHLFDGVYLVPLAAVDRPDLVAPRILRTLGIPLSKEPPEQQLAAHLRETHLLLVLDNFEQILEAAPLVVSLLAAAPRLSVLATSRAPLHVSGEHEYPVPPLRVPEADDVADTDRLKKIGAVALFLDRAVAVRPDFTLNERNAPAVADIVTRLDGLPLALELAAARVKLLPPQTMVRRLTAALDLSGDGNRRDLPDRQRTLRGAIAWSYDLLRPNGRELLRRLAVFRGGATLEAIEAVCRAPAADNLLDNLGTLVDHSLVQVLDQDGEEPRYSMLATIREYAAEKLEEGEDAAEIHLRHLLFFRDLAEQAAAHLTSDQQAVWLPKLDRDRDNLRTALERAISTGDAANACPLLSALWRFFHMRGPVREGRALAEQVVTLEGAPPGEHLAALEAAGGLAYWEGDFPAAERHYRRALTLAHSLNDPARLVEALYNLSFPLSFMGDREGADRFLDEAAALAERVGDRPALARILWAKGDAAFFSRDFPAARDQLTAALQALEGSGQTFMEGWAHRMLGVTLLELGEPVAARPHLEAGMEIFARAGDVSGIILHLADFLALAVLEGDHERALLLSGALRRHEEDSGMGLASVTPTEPPDLAPAFAAVGEERARELLRRGRNLPLEEAVAVIAGKSRPPAS